MRPTPFPILPAAAIAVAIALPAPAQDPGHLTVRLALRQDAAVKVRAMRDAGDKLTFHCTVGIAPGPLKETVWRSDDLVSNVQGTLHDLDGKAPYLTFGPVKPKAERKLKYWTKPDSTVEVTIYLDTRSDNGFRAPWNVIAGRLTLSREAFQGFEKTLASQGVALSAESSASNGITLAPLGAAAGGTGKVETKQSGQ